MPVKHTTETAILSSFNFRAAARRSLIRCAAAFTLGAVGFVVATVGEEGEAGVGEAGVGEAGAAAGSTRIKVALVVIGDAALPLGDNGTTTVSELCSADNDAKIRS